MMQKIPMLPLYIIPRKPVPPETPCAPVHQSPVHHAPPGPCTLSRNTRPSFWDPSTTPETVNDDYPGTHFGHWEARDATDGGQVLRAPSRRPPQTVQLPRRDGYHPPVLEGRPHYDAHAAPHQPLLSLPPPSTSISAPDRIPPPQTTFMPQLSPPIMPNLKEYSCSTVQYSSLAIVIYSLPEKRQYRHNKDISDVLTMSSSYTGTLIIFIKLDFQRRLGVVAGRRPGFRRTSPVKISLHPPTGSPAAPYTMSPVHHTPPSAHAPPVVLLLLTSRKGTLHGPTLAFEYAVNATAGPIGPLGGRGGATRRGGKYFVPSRGRAPPVPYYPTRLATTPPPRTGDGPLRPPAAFPSHPLNQHITTDRIPPPEPEITPPDQYPPIVPTYHA
ncbi:proline-rich extensin-like protein EPR1 [Penaeus monodon]|uniref:proline-rich extensin-like protein EPR1 n=1 Tax=Penaeus monodon TaxID=6687 RepID=UPI0018A78A26|nr:proline-rich extensin-like protein EPR1 [Penaeus monodon]